MGARQLSMSSAPKKQPPEEEPVIIKSDSNDTSYGSDDKQSLIPPSGSTPSEAVSHEPLDTQDNIILGDAIAAKILEAAKAAAVENETQMMYFVLAHDDGTPFRSDCIEGTPGIVEKEALGKIKALSQGEDLSVPSNCCAGLCCYVLPAVCCGATYPIPGALRFTYSGQAYIGSANGSPDPWVDEACMLAGLKAVGIEPHNLPASSPHS